MSDKTSLAAELREDVGKGASRRLRRLGNKVPAIIYGAESAPQNLTLSVNELTKAMEQESFYSQILDVSVAGDVQQAVVRDLQRNPGNGKVTHLDFLRVSADKEIHVSVPLHFINEEQCVGVKIGGGNITHNLTEVEVACLPGNLPEFIEVDMLEVEAGSSLHLSDLTMAEGVSVVALSYGEDRDIPVVSVVIRRGGAEDEDLDAPEATEAEGDDSGEEEASGEE